MTVSNISYEQQFFDDDLNKVNDEDSKYIQGLFLLATQGNISDFLRNPVFLSSLYVRHKAVGLVRNFKRSFTIHTIWCH